MVFGTLWVCQKNFDEQISWVLFRELTWTLCVELAHSGSCWALWLPRLKNSNSGLNRELSSWGTHTALAEALSLTPTTHISCGDWLTTTYSFSSKVSDIFVLCMTSLGTCSHMPRPKPIYIIGNKMSLKKRCWNSFYLSWSWPPLLFHWPLATYFGFLYDSSNQMSKTPGDILNDWGENMGFSSFLFCTLFLFCICTCAYVEGSICHCSCAEIRGH